MTKLARTPFLVFGVCMAFAGMISASEQAGSPQPEVRTLTVQEAVRLTLSHSPEVLIAEAQAARAREALRESHSVNLPRFYTGTGLAYNNGYPLSMEGAAPSIFQVAANKPVFSKTNNNLIREAEESQKAGQLGVEAARNELAAKTASVYYELFQTAKIDALLSSKLDAAIKQQKQIEALIEAGKARPVDARVAETAVLAVRQQILVAQEQAIIVEKELHKLTGLSDTVKILTVEPKIESPIFEQREEALLQRAIETAPGILRAQADVRAKEFHVEAERGAYLPQMEIVGQYAIFSRTNNYEDYFKRFIRNNFLLGLSIQVPIFNGTTSTRVARSRQETSEARYRLESLKSNLKLDIQRALGALRIARGAVDLGRSDVDAAREMVKVSQTLMESGRISEKDLDDSRVQLWQKEMALLDADQMLFQRKLDLLNSAGAIAAAIQ